MRAGAKAPVFPSFHQIQRAARRRAIEHVCRRMTRPGALGGPLMR
jgi:hypothetical protein